jgi:hypothetical protein
LAISGTFQYKTQQDQQEWIIFERGFHCKVICFKDKDVKLILPSSQPSPTGEGAKSSFPPWGK